MSRLRRSFAAVIAVLALLHGCSRETPAEYIASAKEYLERGDRPAAVIQLKNALGKDSSNAEARYLLGKAFLEGEDPVSAAIELQKAVDLRYDPSLVSPLLARAWLNQ